MDSKTDSKQVISKDMLEFSLEGISFNEKRWTSHPSLVADPNKKDPKTKRPIGAIHQSVTIDFSGFSLRDIVKGAYDSYVIKYQNGYARKAEPTKYLVDGKGKPKPITIVAKDFFKGKVSADPVASQRKLVAKTKSIEELKAQEAIIQAEIERRLKESK